MSKIVQAVNAMISNPRLITQVLQNGTEFFFLYRNKYKWSISRRSDGEHWLWYYPGSESLEQLSGFENYEWEETPMVTYKDSEIGTKEAKASFAELYTLVKERLYKVNDVLDDIISDADPL
jgi:hypothetical protein